MPIAGTLRRAARSGPCACARSGVDSPHRVWPSRMAMLRQMPSGAEPARRKKCGGAGAPQVGPSTSGCERSAEVRASDDVSSCGTPNSAGRRFCAQIPLALTGPGCGFSSECGVKFCGRCGIAWGISAATSGPRVLESYTPKHLAEQILAVRSALQGAHKQVTVLFADLTRARSSRSGTRSGGGAQDPRPGCRAEWKVPPAGKAARVGLSA